MIAQDLTNNMIPTLQLADSIDRAIALLEEQYVEQLPVVEKGEYLGMIHESDLFNNQHSQKNIANIQLRNQKVFLTPNTHFLQILKEASQYKLRLFPIVEKQKYLGVVDMSDLTLAMGHSMALQIAGGIFTLSVNYIDYSMSEISRIIESNNAKVLSSFIEEDDNNTDKLKVTIKVNVKDLTAIIATFERFSYKVLAKFHETETQSNESQRLDMLFRYLEM